MCLAHLADGNLHFLVLYDPEAGGGDDAAHAVSDAVVYEPLAPLKGSVSAEHGIGLEKREFLGNSRTAAELAELRGAVELREPRAEHAGLHRQPCQDHHR